MWRFTALDSFQLRLGRETYLPCTILLPNCLLDLLLCHLQNAGLGLFEDGNGGFVFTGLSILSGLNASPGGFSAQYHYQTWHKASSLPDMTLSMIIT